MKVSSFQKIGGVQRSGLSFFCTAKKPLKTVIRR